MMKNRPTSLNIKQIVKERGMSLAYLASKLGIQRSNMSAIASGDRGVSLGVLKKISKIYLMCRSLCSIVSCNCRSQ